MDPRRLRLWAFGLGGLFWAVLTSPAACQAAQPGPGAVLQPGRAGQDPAAAVQSAQSVFVPPDRTAILRLSDARQLLEQERYAEAVRLLGSILENPEDYFFQPDPSSAVHRSLKNEAQRLLGAMPRKGRELYELQYGARARQMLGEAVKAGSAAELAEVARRFFHTQAGYEATLLLGLNYLDHGSPLAGALVLKRLEDVPADSARFEPTLSLAMATCWMRAGMPEKASEVLKALKGRHPEAKVQVAGKEVPLFAEQSASLEWLVALIGPQPRSESEKADQWTMFRGNAARNASSSGGGPLLSVRWQVPTYEHPFVQSLIDQIDQLRHHRDPVDESLPGLHPLVVNDVVLMRTVRNLLAVDFVTGKRIWEVPNDDPFDRAAKLASDSTSNEPGIAMDRFAQQRGDSDVQIGLQLRLWGDATYGTLSSNGELVFAVEDLDLAVGNIAPQRLIAPDADSPSAPRPYNRLAAYDVRTGKLKWHLGGSPTEFHLEQAGVFFLGPPLPLMDELYVLAEFKGEIRLLALNAKSGSVLWSQQLTVVDRDILSDPVRRLTGASPSYADGILVCPTANRSIVAVDVATRSLLWGYSYTEDAQNDQRSWRGFGVRSLVQADPSSRWSDATATIAEGRVLVTPPDSDQIQCLSLIDGRLLWSQPRQDDRYLACIYRGKAVLVGRNRVRALRLEDGRPAWDGQTTALPEDSLPSGRGFTSGDRYYLPVSTAEVLAVALDTGGIARKFKSRNGTVPGNLVCYKGHVVSQRADAVELFAQLDALRAETDRRLEANPQDAEALALRGQISWDDGQLKQAVELLRRSWNLTHDSRTRELLRDSLLEGLRTDFVAYRPYEDEILHLVDQPQQRATYLRLMASGCEAAQQLDAALDYYLKLIDVDRGHRDLEVVDKSLVVRRDRWLQTQLAGLRAKAPPEVQTKLDRAGQSRLEEADKAASADALRQYLDYFGGLPIAEQARRHLLDRLKKDGRWLEAELLLQRQQRSADPQTAAAALAELAQLLRDAGRFQDAAVCYERLKSDFADVACRDGKTGRQLVDALPADDAVGKVLQPRDTWPVGKVRLDSDSRPAGSPQLAFTRSIVDYQGSPSPFFSDIDIEMRQAPAGLVARDGLGQQLWELSSGELSDQINYMATAAFTRIAVQGHLLLVAMGEKIIAVDTLSGKETGSPRILWSRDLEEENGNELDLPASIRRPMTPAFGGIQRMEMAHAPDASSNVPVVISEQLFCYQRFRDLLAIEPTTGTTLWTRHGVEPGSILFGDQEYVLIAAPGQSMATVLRATDGSLVGTRPLAMQRAATVGRCVLAVEDVSGARVLQLVDPLDSRQVWPEKRFAPDTKLCLVDREAVGAMEPNGRFVLADLSSGRVIIDAKLPAVAPVEAIHVLHSPDGYWLVTSGGEHEENSSRRVYPLQPGSSVLVSRGWVWGFSRAGKLLWPEPVPIQNQHLPLSQPRRLPVLVFACMIHERRPNVPIQATTSLVFIDKRTGRKYTKELAYATNNFQLVGTPDKKTVQMQLQRNSVTLTFTDEPLGPKPSETTSNSGTPRTLQAFWRALGAGAQKALNSRWGPLAPSGAARKAEQAVEETIQAAQSADKTAPRTPSEKK